MVAVLGILLTISGLITSVLAIDASASNFARADVGTSQSVLLTIGAIGALWAIVMFILWLKFLKGSRASRTWLAIFVVLHVVFGFASASAMSGPDGRLASAFYVAGFEIIVLLLMFVGKRTAEFFAKT